jgi:flagella basal body P-ring formation protein FlgA
MHATSVSTSFFVAVLAVCATAASAATQISLRDNVEMTKHVVRLGDVAEISSDDAEQARDLASLPLIPAPVAGGQQFLRQREIKDAIAAHGIDLKSLTIGGAKHVKITGSGGPATVREFASRSAADTKADRQAALASGRVEMSSLARSGTEIDSESAAILNDGIRALISLYLTSKSAEAGGYTVTCDLQPRHLASLANATSRPVCTGGAAPWTGRQRFEISFATAEGATKIPVYAEVKPAATPVVVAVRPMARGEVVTAADVELQEIGYVARPGDRRVVARSIDSLVGMEVRQPLPAGVVVYMDTLQPPLLVKRGELVRISSQSGGIRVETTARALQDRSHGQLVEVESLTTKERFDARVVGPGQAAIVAIAAPAVESRTAPIETARRR